MMYDNKSKGESCYVVQFFAKTGYHVMVDKFEI